MGRNILAVIVGYIAMAILIFVVFTAAYLALGDEGSFKEGSFEVSMQWVIMSIVVGLIAAVLGGITCAKISKHSKGAVMSLAVLVLVLGGLSAIAGLMAERPTGEDAIRGPETSNTEAMMQAQQPAWVLIANPIIGVVGVMLGATLVCPKHGPGASDSDAE
jgi:MFS family permease